MRQEFIPGDYDVTRKHSVVPLPVLSKNEQCYTDVIQILDSYEETVAEIFKASGKVFDGKTKVHIGGDQLTRERFSGAKRLRKDAITEEEQFELYSYYFRALSFTNDPINDVLQTFIQKRQL